MADAVFAGGVPAKITIHDFRRHCLQSFPGLRNSGYDGLISDAIDSVYAMFAGVGRLWDWESGKPSQIWYDKTVLCYRLLVSWYIADLYPVFVSGTPVMGGIPIKRKKIDSVDIVFADGAGNSSDLLESLKSNPWGMKAYVMIKTAGKRALLRNCRII